MIVVANFFLQDKLEQNLFLKKLFLMANTYIKIVLDILFLFLFNVYFRFVKEKLMWKKYIIIKILLNKK